MTSAHPPKKLDLILGLLALPPLLVLGIICSVTLTVGWLLHKIDDRLP